mmetsp:Transcript_79332/g.199317  ORF Transcript_79332/g.199317 Transcript_79332/m.199317 type:complete len:231 (-) Transcript_79332:874-1566(-)
MVYLSEDRQAVNGVEEVGEVYVLVANRGVHMRSAVYKRLDKISIPQATLKDNPHNGHNYIDDLSGETSHPRHPRRDVPCELELLGLVFGQQGLLAQGIHAKDLRSLCEEDQCPGRHSLEDHVVYIAHELQSTCIQNELTDIHGACQEALSEHEQEVRDHAPGNEHTQEAQELVAPRHTLHYVLHPCLLDDRLRGVRQRHNCQGQVGTSAELDRHLYNPKEHRQETDRIAR